MKAEFEINMPKKLWIAILSKKYSNIKFEILSILPTEKMVGNALVKISGSGLDKILKEIKGHSSCLELFDQHCTYVLYASARDILLQAARPA